MADFVSTVLRELRQHPEIEVEKGNNGHWKVSRHGRVVTTIPSTMFEGPAANAVLAHLKKYAGVDLFPRQERSDRPRTHRPTRRQASPYTKKTALASIDELQRQLNALSESLRHGDRDPSIYQRVQEVTVGARRDVEALTRRPGS